MEKDSKQSKNSPTLAILAIIFGAIAYFTFWIPVVNFLTLPVAIAGFILMFISLAKNKSNKRLKLSAAIVASIGFGLSIAGVTFAILFSSFHSSFSTFYSTTKSYQQTPPSSSSSKSSSSADKTKPWTYDAYKQLNAYMDTNDFSTASSYNDVIQTFGSPTTSTSTTQDSVKVQICEWDQGTATIRLIFARDKDGNFILMLKQQQGLSANSNT